MTKTGLTILTSIAIAFLAVSVITFARADLPQSSNQTTANHYLQNSK